MNRFGSNRYENENDQFAQNRRVGRILAENNPRPWNETYQPLRPAPIHHRVNPPYRPDYMESRQPDYRNESRNDYRNEEHFYAGAHHDYPANDPAWRHHDDRYWTERNDYKDDDYRYRSGHRNYWHEDYDDQYEPQHEPHRRHPDSFISHLGQGIRQGWNNLIHPDEQRERDRAEARRRQRMYPDQPRHWPNAVNYPREDTGESRNSYENELREEQYRRWQQQRQNRYPGSDY